MEQEQLHPPQAGDETFARVWRRAMPEDRPDCPFVLEQDAPPQPRLKVEVLSPAECPRELPCLGAASGRYGADLQAFITDEMGDFHAYLLLARRLPGAGAKTLAGLAAEEHRHAKRLATAYFLISGVRYLPDRAIPSPTEPLHAALRGRYLAEQAGSAAYRAAAERCADPCLRALYQDLAGDEAGHAFKVRVILEEL